MHASFSSSEEKGISRVSLVGLVGLARFYDPSPCLQIRNALVYAYYYSARKLGLKLLDRFIDTPCFTTLHRHHFLAAWPAGLIPGQRFLYRTSILIKCPDVIHQQLRACGLGRVLYKGSFLVYLSQSFHPSSHFLPTRGSFREC